MHNDERSEQKVALEGSKRAVSGATGKGEPKIGVEEFMSVAERFGFSEQTLSRIREAAESDSLDGGPFLANYYSGLTESKVQAYERTARELFGSVHAMGVSSGTGALHAAFVAAGVGPGTEVVCPAIGFFATAAAVVAANGVPVFCDVDESLMMDPVSVESRITPRTVAIAPTHYQGNVCDMDALMGLARGHGLRVVEDCAQSCGASFGGRYVGTIGDLGCFSISAYKIVGGGEGGLLLTDDGRLCDRASQVIESGGLWRPVRFAPERYPGELFCGTNYRMSELEAAVDVVQLRRMPSTVARFRHVRREVLRRLPAFRGVVPQRLNDPDGDVGYAIRFFPDTVELGAQIVEALRVRNIGASMRGRSDSPDWHLYRYMFPVTRQGTPTEVPCPFACPHYTERGGRAVYDPDACPVADDLYERCVAIPLSQWYTDEDCDRIAAGIRDVLSGLCGVDGAGVGWLP